MCFVLNGKILPFFWLAKTLLKSRMSITTWWLMRSL